ncbi:MAG: PKD domain-containing protein, partial [Flavobacteriales bacterium]|nr:PKD domain-containing protein [Flavobacteriales bacterium]
MRKLFKKATTILACITLSYAALACNNSTPTVTNVLDNGDGTYDIIINVCIAIGGSSAGATEELTITPTGGTFTSILSFPANYSTAYNYCDGGCPGNSMCGSVAGAVGSGPAVLNGGGASVSYFSGTTLGTQFGPTSGEGGCGNLGNVISDCQDITITTTGLPATITVSGPEGATCNTSISLPAPPVSTTGCTGTFTDSGGNSNYSNNESSTISYCSDDAGPITLDFTSFLIESGWDFLSVYDGPTEGSPLVGTYTGSAGPGIVTSSGTCITIVFTSDGSVTSAGWSFDVSCVTVVCTPPTGGFDITGGTCIGSTFTFTNTGDAPGSGPGGMGDPTYSWDFDGDGTIDQTGTSAAAADGSSTYAAAGNVSVTQTMCTEADPTCCTTITQVVTVAAPPTLSTVPTDETCAGMSDGSIDLTVTGGSGSFSYSWDNGAGTGQDPAGLAPGTYTVDVTDITTGCIVQTSAVIVAGPGPVAVLTATGSGCVASNSFTFDGTGSTPNPDGMGDPVYNFDFNDGNTVLTSSTTGDSQTHSFTTAGTFAVSVTVTDGACSSTATTSVTVIANITLTAVPTPESCDGVNDGSIDLTVTGGS